MENTASISDREAVPAAIGPLSLHGQPPPVESAANRVSRIGGRTARRVLVADVIVLGLRGDRPPGASAPVVGAPRISRARGVLLALLTILASYAVSSLYATVQRPTPT